MWSALDALKSSKRSLYCIECDCKVSLCPNEDASTALEDEEKQKSELNLSDIQFSTYNVELFPVYSSQIRQMKRFCCCFSFLGCVLLLCVFCFWGGGGRGRVGGFGGRVGG